MRLPTLVLLAAATLPLAAQQTTTLDVVVTDKKGTPMPGLAQSDFVVHVAGRAEPTTAFRAVTPSTPNAEPVETILLIDAVNIRTTSLSYERSQIEKFLRRNGGHLAQPTTAIIVTDTNTQILPGTTRDGNALADTIDKANIGLRIFNGRQGFYSWTEQFNLSSTALQRVAAYERTRPGRKLLLWISPGWPLLSGPEIELTSKQQEGFFNVLVHLTDDLHAARITLSSIDPLGTNDAVSYRTVFFQQFTKPVPDARHMQIGNLALQALATQSGGRVLNSNNDTAALLTEAASDAEAFYTLTVPLPPPSTDSARTDSAGFTPITVSVEKPGLTARARTVLYTAASTTDRTPTPNVPPPTR